MMQAVAYLKAMVRSNSKLSLGWVTIDFAEKVIEIKGSWKIKTTGDLHIKARELVLTSEKHLFIDSGQDKVNPSDPQSLLHSVWINSDHNSVFGPVDKGSLVLSKLDHLCKCGDDCVCEGEE